MEHYDLTIIGTGSGNSILDERYAGKKVAICEQGTFGGTCLNVGCIPTKMFVYAADVAEAIRTSSRYGVDSHIDKVRWPDIVARVSAESIPSPPAVRITAATTRTSPSTPATPGSAPRPTTGATPCAPRPVTNSAVIRW